MLKSEKKEIMKTRKAMLILRRKPLSFLNLMRRSWSTKQMKPKRMQKTIHIPTAVLPRPFGEFAVITPRKLRSASSGVVIVLIRVGMMLKGMRKEKMAMTTMRMVGK